MSWGASANPNVRYLAACSRVLGLARGTIRPDETGRHERPPQTDPRRSLELCEECGCLFLTHSSDPRATTCWPCIRRERDEFEREQDRQVFERYLLERGPGNPYRLVQPEPRVEAEVQEVLF